jgi:hypothetical protein
MRAGVRGHGHTCTARRISISGQKIYWGEMQFRDKAIFEECYVPLKVALYIEDDEAISTRSD